MSASCQVHGLRCGESVDRTPISASAEAISRHGTRVLGDQCSMKNLLTFRGNKKLTRLYLKSMLNEVEAHHELQELYGSSSAAQF